MNRPGIAPAQTVAPGEEDLAAPFALTVDRRPALRTIDDRLVPTVSSKNPVLAWKSASSPQSVDVVGFEVDLSDDSGRPVWTSGTVESADHHVVVDGDLEPLRVYDWRVRIVDSDGRRSQWARSRMETGPFDYAQWKASWLSVPHLARVVTHFRMSSTVSRARLYLTGQGVVRAWVNDAVVNPDRMDPTRTDLVRALYRTYDVTDLLSDGQNALVFVAGLGEWARTGESPRLLAELVVWHEDGSITRVSPGVGSGISSSEVTDDVPFYLERHDQGAVSRGISPSTIQTLEPADLPESPATPPSMIASDGTPPVREVAAFTPTELERTPESRLFDVGVNIAGRSRLVVHGGVPRGTMIRVLHGEHIGGDGHIDTTNLTMPFDDGRERQLIEYVANGDAGQAYEPWFVYHGFRYLEVRGLPSDASVTVTAHSMHTDLARSGYVSTDSTVIDRLLTMAERTLLNNVHGVPEDCPTREQAAWTGDTASVAEYELAAFDSAAFLDKWIADLETSQQPDGQLPAVAPDMHASRMPSDPVWGSALHRMLRGHLLHYGDLSLVRRALPTLRRWADFQLGCVDEDGIVSRSPISYGHDWLALEQTPPPIHHTGAVIDCLLALADLEEAIGDTDAAIRRRDSADALRRSARRQFFDPASGTFGNGSQGSFAVAIETGILTGEEAHRAGERLVERVRERGNRVSGGFATTRSVVRALTMIGASQTVADILSQSEAPGVGAMLTSGPGTFWECWWIDPANTGTGSLNHVGLGGPFAAWVWEGLAGLRPTAPGYSRFRIEPQFVAQVNTLELRTETVLGEVAVGYARERAGTRSEVTVLTITVPPRSEGTLVIAGRTDAVLSPGTHVITVRPSADALRFCASPSSRGASTSSRGAAIDGRDLLAADVVGSRALLELARLSPGRAAPTIESLHRLRCMPVPHEQPAHSVQKIVATAGGIGAPTVLLALAAPIPVAGVTFFYALIDQCLAGPDRVATPFFRLRLSNGETRSSSGALWPAGWNRVAVDVADLDDELAVTEMEVGLEYRRDAAGNALALYPAQPGILSGFHLSEIGFSTVARTW
ncbi:family 78 glycoside hydrolase catalytic domain [Microbacterium profundi]